MAFSDIFLQICHCAGSQGEAESDLHQPHQGSLQPEVQRDVRRVSRCRTDDRWRHHQPHCLLPRHDNRGKKKTILCGVETLLHLLVISLLKSVFWCCSIQRSVNDKLLLSQILRSMLYRGSEIMREVAWVIFDEIHYMRDTGGYKIEKWCRRSVKLQISVFWTSKNQIDFLLGTNRIHE